jgi:hypothetical protein
MSWLYLPGQVSEFGAADCSDGKQSATSKKTPTASTCLKPVSETDILTTPQSGPMYAALLNTTMPPSILSAALENWLLSLSSLLVFPANHSAVLENSWAPPIGAMDGPIPFALFKRSGPNGSYWRMSQGCFPSLMFDEYSETWPRAGMMQNGIAYQLRPLAPITREIASGLWATPVSSDFKVGVHNHQMRSLPKEIMFPTPVASDNINRKPGNPFLTSTGTKANRYTSQASKMKYSSGPTLQEVLDQMNGSPGGKMNPDWVEWLMGAPIGATALEPLDKAKYQQWLELHGKT